MQDCFVRAWRAYPRLEPGGNYRAWLYKIATNTARTRLQRSRRELAHSTALDPEKLPDPAPLDQLEQAEQMAVVSEAIDRLPEKQRAALILRKYQGLGYAELAAALDISPDAARANVYQALKKLRAQFEGQTEGSSQ